MSQQCDNCAALAREIGRLNNDVVVLHIKLAKAREALESIAGWADHADPRAIEDKARQALKELTAPNR